MAPAVEDQQDIEPIEKGETEREDLNGSIDESIRSRLQKRRKEIGDKGPEDFDLPGFDGELVVRYKPLEWEDHKQIAERVEKSKNPKRELHGQMDTLILACEQIFVRGSDKKLHPVPTPGGEPAKFDNSLGAFLGFDPEGSARRALWETFGGNEVVITSHFNEVREWMEEANRKADDDFLGESKG